MVALFISRLKEEREKLNISQKELSYKLNVSQQTIGSWEVGRTEPSHDNLQKLCNLFNVSIDYLLGRTSARNYPLLLNTKLISLRNEKDLSQQELAKLVGIGVNDIVAFEQGIKKPDPQVLNRLCKVFDVTLDYLMGRADDDQESPSNGLDKEIVRLIKEADDKDKVKMLLKASNNISKENVEKAIRIMEALGED